MIPRSVGPRLIAALADTPAVMLVGPRQAGKSTLVQEIAREGHPARYLTLDDLATLGAARRDPVGFVDALDGPAVIDEIQREPDLLLPIKAAIDRDRRPGSFILTGSAQVLLLPRVSESLAGRMEVHTLWPLSVRELRGSPDSFGARLFAAGSAETPPSPALSRPQLIEHVVAGGFPEALAREGARRQEWFDAYLTTVAEREVRDLASIERLSEVPSLLTHIAARVRAPLNKSDLSGALGVPRTSLDRYLTLLEHVFLVRALPAWHTSTIKQLTKSPKLLVSDSGLLCRLLRATPERLEDDQVLLGVVAECFAGMEILKQLDASVDDASLFHLRTAKGDEIDFVVEDAGGRVAGLEVKTRATVRAEDFRHLELLRDRLGSRFARGVVLYTGGERLPFGDRLEAWPLSGLWA